MNPSSDPQLHFPQWRAFAVALLGIGVLFATPPLTSYSYTVTSVSADAKQITISYVYPLLPLLPGLLASGVVLTAFGLWSARKLLVTHKSIPVILGWLALVVGSGPLSNWIFNAVATAGEFTLTPEYGIRLLWSASTFGGLSALGVWMTRKLLRSRRKALTLAFGLGALATLVSVVWMTHVVDISFEQYQRGFPFPWLVLTNGLVAAIGWFPTAFFVYDLLFWSALAYGSVLFAKRLRQQSN